MGARIPRLARTGAVTAVLMAAAAAGGAAVLLDSACAGPAQARVPRPPGLLWHDGGRRGAFVVRPRSVYDTEDGSGVIGVLRRHGDEVEHGPGRGFLRWTRWTATSGRATGTYWIKLGSPAATSRFTREPLTLLLSRVRSGHFTRMRLRYRQSGRRADVILCLSKPFHGSYTWDELYRGRCT